jgi:hypothetical protein
VVIRSERQQNETFVATSDASGAFPITLEPGRYRAMASQRCGSDGLRLKERRLSQRPSCRGHPGRSAHCGRGIDWDAHYRSGRGVLFGQRETQFGVTQANSTYRVEINFANVGSVGNIKKQERLF